ncbi:YadA-like family protein [Burkholderia cepacia]|uniref:YadA-like family protein n=1 Tax=Burkholderia cepacia TaxID=292 RepID=UPI00157B847A|nr:YadA-like family protein [Burkholderia cepacia]NTX49197.1 YadA-like family protein [Burkholderia cepacia]
MNKSYRVVWNASTSTWCAASEITRGRSKSSGSAKSSKAAAAAALVMVSMGSAYAEESGAADAMAGDSAQLAEGMRADRTGAKPSMPTTRMVVPDNAAYVKIDAKGDGSDNALAQGERSIAIGANASTRPAAAGLGGAVAIGDAATASGNNVALGANASALGDQGAIALGGGANASGKSSIALGNDAQATGWGAYALGRKAKASAESALAIGDSSMATRQGTMALGSQAAASAENAIAIGQSAAARGADSIALGSYSESDRDQTVSVGSAGFERQVVNVGHGTQSTDAVNVAQLKGVAEVLGGSATIDANGNVKKPTYTIGSKTYDNVGDALQAASSSGGGTENAVQYDSDAQNSVTLGGADAAAVKLTNVRAAALSAKSTDAVNGAQLFATNGRVTDIEKSLTDSGLIDSSTGESLAVVYDSATKGTVALGGTGGTAITNVKAGKIASTSKDAVNGGQLYGVSSSIASALGGESAVNTDGTVSKPAYKIGDKTYDNVGDAIQAAAATGGAGGGEDASAVHYDGANKSSVTLGGTGASKTVSLKNVATGVADTDAVNVAQLQSGLSDVKTEITDSLKDGSLDMKYIKVNAKGIQANALGPNSVAIGSSASATNKDTLAIGSGARASGTSSIAIGINSVATQANTVSVGSSGAERRIVNLGDGVDDNDAVNMKQLHEAFQTAGSQVREEMTRAMPKGGMTRDTISKPGSFVAVEGMGDDGSLPSIASMNGKDPTSGTAAAIGVSSAAAGVNAIAVGLQSVAQSDNSVAIGSMAQTGVDQPYSVAIGTMVTTNGTRAIGIGAEVRSNGENSVAVGNNFVSAIGDNSVAIGNAAKAAAGAVNSIAVGKSANVALNVTDALALGANTSVTAGGAGGVALGSGSVANRGTAVSVGSGKAQRQIVNVAKGTQSTDAVNLSQLKGVTDALGGGSGIGTDGAVTAPSYTVGDKTYNNVGDALAAMSESAGGTDPNAVAYDSEKKDKVTLAGENGTTLTNVKAGKVSADSKDAVNGAQLHDTAQSVADALGGGSSVDENGELTAPTYSLADPEDESKQTEYHTVGDALENLDGRVAGNTTEITNIKNEFKDAGLVDGDGDTRAVVTYGKNADGTPNFKSVKLAGEGGTILSNVAAGKADMDAVNVSQLKLSGLIGGDGKTRVAVTYDKNEDGTANYGKATLAGEGGTTLSNVKAGKVSTDSKDAVNGAQLHDTAQNVADALGGGSSVDENGKSTAPTYSLADPVDGTKEIAYHNVGDALENLDGRVAGNTTEITNIKNEFKDAGLVDGDGHTRAAVTYDKNADGTANYKSATLAGEGGTTLTNVKAGKVSADSKDAINGAQLHDTAQSVADALGGGSSVDENGKSTAPTYSLADPVDGTKEIAYHNVGDALENLDGRVAGNTTEITNIKNEFKDTGLVDGDGHTRAAVTYDKNTDGTANYKSATLAGEGGTTLSNVADGKADKDAVNVSQLKSSGLVGEDGKARAAVTYDKNADGTANYKSATLAGENGTTLSNVADGKADKDAVNVSQLKSSGLVGEDGKARAAVTYDKNTDGTANYKSATLAGENGTTLSNVADGKADKDAVNVSQLKSSGLVGEDGKARAAVTYDKNTDGTANYKSATLAGEGGTTLSNVKAGQADKDAVNVSQLKSSGLIGEDGKALAAVTYDKKADGTPDYGSVTFGNGKSADPVKLSNIAKGTDGADAVNVDQLTEAIRNVEGGMNPLSLSYDDVSKSKATLAGENGTTLTNVKAGKVSADSKDAINGAQLHDTAQSMADALGGGSSVDENGKLTAPTYSLADPVDGTKEIAYHNVGDALENLDGRVAGNTTEITNIKNEFKDAGLVDGDGHTRAAVTYDKNADGTANYGKATLAGENGTTLSNVADGKADKDAVNVSQLKSSGLVGEDGKARAAVTYDKKADGTADYGKATLAGENGTTLSNVKAGKVSADSKDAINGAQLHDTAQSVADTLGGGSSVDENGKLTAPSYSLTDPVDGSKQIEYHTVGDALENLDGRVAGNTTEITNIKNEFKDTGLVDGDGHTRAAVTYDKNADGTPNYGKATLAGESGTILSNVKAGVADKDAVNVSQLKSSGLIGEDGKALAAVTYDKKADGTPDYGSVTFGNGKSADPVKLSNIAKGTDGADAVNVDQLTEAIRNVEGGMNPLSLSYDDVSKSKATLAGENGTILSNVKAGTSDMDAVNVSQLKSTGLIDEDGKARAAVMYDKNADGTPNYKSATLAGENGTVLSNVADGKADKDAVNVSQLKSSGLIDKDGKARAAVTYDKNADGTPNYGKATLAGESGTILSNVKAGVADKDAVNVSQLKSSGLVGEDGKARAAVTYDKNADGTPNYKSATLAGLGGTTLSNVADGKADKDAVNVSQLKSTGLIDEDGKARAAVMYDKNADGTPNYKSATLAGLGGTTLSNVADGKADKDAVNVSQLKSTGLIDEDGKALAAMTYDKNADGTPNYKSATLAGEGGTTLSNVKAGKADKDAVNVSQLKSSGLIGEDGKALAAVTYDKNIDGTPNYKSATLAGLGGTTLSNVADGKADRDAVNVSQLKSSGLIDKDGKARAAVTYDKNADGTPNYKSATLAGLGGTTLSNVADGKADKDAVNVSQLKSAGLIGEDGKALAAVTYDKNLDGTPNFKSATLAGLGGTTLSNVKAGVADRDAVNVSQLKSSGLIGEDGNAHAAVTYDKNLDGTPNYGSVTLGGGKSEKTVMLSNVATGVLGTDAVNVDQLTDGLSNLEDKLVNGAIDLKYIKVRSDGIAARAIGDQAVAIGASANATGQYTMALGSGSRASGKNSVAIGVNSVADEADTVAVGRDGEERRIVHVKAGQVDASSTDAVNGSQLYAALDQINASVAEQQRSLRTLSQTRDVTSPPGSFIAVEGLAADGGSPNMASINGKDPKSGTAAAIGISSTAAGLDTVAVGLQSIAQSDNAVAIGSFAQTGVDQEYSVAIGSMVTTNGVGAIGIGSKVRSNGENSVAVGTNGAAAIADSSVVVGDRAKVWAGAVNGIAIGSNASVNLGVTDAIALGANAKALKPGSIAIGAGSTADRANAVSFGALGAERQLVNVAKGTVNTDAVNVGQLRDAMAAFGGNADIAKDGSVTAPTYTIGGQTYHDVEAALNAAAESGGAADPNGVAYDSVKKDKVTLAGQDGTTLTNLKAGDLTETSKDAVTGAQLFATNQSLDGLQQSLKDGGVIDSKTGESLAVTYESTLKDKVALAGQDGTTLSNVKAGTADMDAVNVSQLKSSGLIGEGGKSLSAVTYDTRADGTTDFASVTFGGVNANIPVALHNIAAGKASTDAVNVSQLKGVTDAIGGGAGIDTDGKVTAPVYTVDGTEYASVGDAIKALEQREGGSGNGSDPNAVAYDDDAKATVTLAGKKGTVIGNVAGGSLAVDSTEAVNGGQLNTVTQSIADSLGGGAKFDPVTGKIAAPKYELTELDGSKSSFGNVGDAFQHLDDLTSENVKQIEGLYKDVANAVQYDDEKHTSVTLGSIDVKPVTLKNVADGTDETDAVNVRQLRSAGLVDDKGVMQSAVVYDKNTDGTTNYGSVTLGGFGSVTPVGLHNVAAGTAATDAVNVSQLSGVVGALGGDAKIDAETGKVIAPTYHVGNIDFDNAGDALSNLDGRVKQIQNNITNPVELAGAVMYGKNGDGSVNYGMVKLGNGSGPVVLTNVKAGTTEYDAVNYGQFSELKGRVSDIDERLNAATTPGNGGGAGTNGNGLIDGTGGSGTNSAEILAAKPGNGNGNVAAGSSSQVADGQHNGTAVGAGSKVMADSGTAVGHGATVSADATNSVALGQGSKATEANTVSIGSEGAERRIVNVADGVKATDAVSKGQFDRAMGGMQGQINDLSRNAYSGIAAATALAMIPSVDPGKNISFGIGGASYKGYQAVSLGGEARITENLKMRAGVGMSSGGNTFGVGASYQW